MTGDKSRWTFIGTVKDLATGDNLPEVSDDLRGIGFDEDGFAWTLGLGSDRVFKIDPATNARHLSLPTGKSIGVGPHYTYSDMTGSTALSFTAPRGVWRHSVQYDTDCNVAEALYWQAYVPPGTSIGARIRAVDGASSAWVPGPNDYFQYPEGQPAHQVDLRPYADQLKGTRFEIEVRLGSDPGSNARPILHEVHLPATPCIE